jgi:hypothetical protein
MLQESTSTLSSSRPLCVFFIVPDVRVLCVVLINQNFEFVCMIFFLFEYARALRIIALRRERVQNTKRPPAKERKKN